MTVRYAGQTTYKLSGVDVPLPSVTIYVYSSDTGQLAVLTDDSGNSLQNPFTSDSLGNFYYRVAAAGLYDHLYYVGGKEVFRENGIPVGGYSAAFSAVAQNLINTTVFTVTSANGQAVTTRGLLTGIAAPPNGSFAYLGEDSLEGTLKFSSASNTAGVTADPDQALIVAGNGVSSGASGTWARPRSQRIYDLLWWLHTGTAWTETQTPIQRAFDAIEPGSLLKMPRYGTAEMSGPIVLKTAGVTIEGSGDQFAITHKASTSPFTMLQIAASGVRVRRLAMVGKYQDSPAANAACIIVSTNASYTHQQVLDDVEVADCKLTQASLPLVAFGQDASADSVVVPATNIRFLRNYLGTDYQGVSIFGCDDVLVEGNHIVYLIAPISVTNAEGARILGSHRVLFKDNYLDSSAGIGGTDHAGIRFSGAMLGSSNYTRRQNTDVRVFGNYFNNFNHGIIYDECLGDLDISHNKFIFDRTRTDANFGIQAGAVGQTFGGVVTTMDRMVVRHNLFYGVATGVDILGPGKHFSYTDNRVICNARTANDATVLAGRTLFGGFKLVEFVRNRFYSPINEASQFAGLTLLGNSGETYVIRDNWIGETNSSPGTMGAGAYDNQSHAGNYYAGNNASYPLGTYANII